MMDWKRLLSSNRLGKDKAKDGGDLRSPYQRDFDRVVFSSAFRRLQDKTQVFPLPQSDYVRTRLTHSLEVSSVGRSLGEMAGAELIKLHPELVTWVTKSDFGAIVATACLAHDIGNPPFGHSGEASIQDWFQKLEKVVSMQKVITGMSLRQSSDFRHFEGNAQGFRILTRLQNATNRGGLQLTMATLATFMKYPRESKLPEDPERKGQSGKKFGFFQSEVEFAEEVADAVGLIRRDPKIRWWGRHPLAFLVEAADDICYKIIDFEDGFKLGLISFSDAKELFSKIDNDKDVERKLKGISDKKEQIEYLRAQAIGTLVRQVVREFLNCEIQLLEGNFDSELVAVIPAASVLAEIHSQSKEKVYNARSVVEIEAAGFAVLSSLLNYFVYAAYDVSANGQSASSRSETYTKLLPPQSIIRLNNASCSNYERILVSTDFVSGMTDSYAVSVYKKMTGISLPER